MPQDVRFGFRFRRPTPVVGATLVVLVAIWVTTAIAVRAGQGWIYEDMALRAADVFAGRHLWTVLTHSLLHSLEDTDHLVFNSLVFYFFAPELETLWGRARFVGFMVLAALGAAAFYLGAYAIGLSTASGVVGFSGVVMAVTTAWGLLYPDREVFLLIFPLKGIHLVYATIALQVLTALSFSRVSASAHFGGIAVGAAVAATQHGPLRRWWLQRKLATLQAQSAALKGERRAGGPSLRLIKGGGSDEPPKDKRYLN
jgi:membrane associated rhomboid family serine protease